MLAILKYFTKKDWGLITISVALIVFQVWLDLKLPDYMADITKHVQSPGSTIAEIWDDGVLMLGCALGSLATAFIVSFLAARLAAGLSMRLRGQVFNKVLSFSLEEINQFSTASLITRSTNDITQVQMLVVMGVQVIVKAPILAVWAVMKISTKNIDWTMATAVAVAFLLIVVAIVVLFAVPKSKLIQTLTDQLNRVTREHLMGLRVVKAYNAEPYQAAKFKAANDNAMAANLFVNRTTAIIGPSMNAIMSGLTLSIYWIGAAVIQQATLPNKLNLFSDMVVFTSYAMQIIMAFMMMTMVFIMLPRASVSAKRILEVLHTEAKIVDGAATSTHKTSVEFRNVTFRYPDAADAVLHNISFRAEAGETVAIIGSTGSGKTTLVNLLPRFYDVTDGAVLVNDVDVRDYVQHDLHEKLGYVAQKAFMFTGSVQSNVAYGREQAVEDDVQRAVAIAQAEEFVAKLDGTYGAPITQGGTNLSGGQKQRLNIARAMYKRPDIYIFDDSFSALDYKTERNLRHRLQHETEGAIKFVVAQRIGTIKEADQIIVLDEGKMVGLGRHHELLKTCDVYREIAYSQLTKEEIGDE